MISLVKKLENSIVKCKLLEGDLIKVKKALEEAEKNGKK